MWHDLVKTTLIGTDKTTPSVETLEKIKNWGVNSDEISEIVLEGAGISALLHKTGYLLEDYDGILPVQAEKEEGILCSPKSAQHLKKILSDGHNGLLIEFLYLLQTYNKSIPYEHLPEILHLARGNRQLQAQIVPLIGNRGIWLIQQNTDWKNVDTKKTAAIKAPPQLNSAETLEEARQIMDIFRTNHALWADESNIVQQLKDFASRADPALVDKLEHFFEEDFPYYWQQRIRQMLSTLFFRRQMLDELKRQK